MADLLTLVRLFFTALTVLFVGSMVKPKEGAVTADGAADIRCFFIACASIFWGLP
ncbi:hypothetical protein BPIT_21010 [Candidatus Brocadia pituitae]|nr:hypothetical protein BPIT_21010 [Candidatus Brocadia pituitae]